MKKEQPQGSQAAKFSNPEGESKPTNKKSKKNHDEFEANSPLVDEHTFRHLLVNSSILDSKENVEPVIKYITEEGKLRDKPIQYEIKFNCAVKAIKKMWENQTRHFSFYLKLLFDCEPLDEYGPSVIRKKYWPKCVLDEDDEWLETLDLWMTGFQTLEGFFKVTNISLSSYFLHKSEELENHAKIKKFKLWVILDDNSKTLKDAYNNGSLSKEAQRKLEELYKPFDAYLSEVFSITV